MLFFLILSQIFLFSNQNKNTENGMIIKEVFIENLSSFNLSIYCSNSNSNKTFYIERPTNIKVIRNTNKYNSYSSVYISDKIDENEISKFPESTVFFINKEIFDFSKINNNSNYCFISYDNKINKYSFLKSGKKINSYYEEGITYFLVLFSIANFLNFIIFRAFYSLVVIKLEVNIIANILLVSCIFLSFSCLFYIFFNVFSVAYSIYKSYLIVKIIYLLKGYKILYFQDQAAKRKMKSITILLSIFEAITTIIFLYSGNIHKYNLYFICGKNIIEYLVLLIITIIMFLNHFINLYRQYRFERRIRTILTLAYKYKLITYSKVFIFSLFYSLGFIAIHIFSMKIFYKAEYDDYQYGFFNSFDEIHFLYYTNISLAILFAIIFSIMFFPLHNSLLFFIESNININMYFVTEIKKAKEINMQIGKLKKNILKQKYYKKEYPLIFLEPFAKTNNFLNDCHIHVGITKKK